MRVSTTRRKTGSRCPTPSSAQHVENIPQTGGSEWLFQSPSLPPWNHQWLLGSINTVSYLSEFLSYFLLSAFFCLSLSCFRCQKHLVRHRYYLNTDACLTSRAAIAFGIAKTGREGIKKSEHFVLLFSLLGLPGLLKSWVSHKWATTSEFLNTECIANECIRFRLRSENTKQVWGFPNMPGFGVGSM